MVYHSALVGKRGHDLGNGKQARDIFFVDDLITCYLKAVECIEHVRGMTCNIGPGPRNTLSLFESVEMFGGISERPGLYTHSDWRSGDQRVYVFDIRSATKHLAWEPRLNVCEGVRCLYEWVSGNLNFFTA